MAGILDNAIAAEVVLGEGEEEPLAEVGELPPAAGELADEPGGPLEPEPPATVGPGAFDEATAEDVSLSVTAGKLEPLSAAPWSSSAS